VAVDDPFELLPDGVLVAGPDWRLRTVNSAAGRLLGVSPSDAVGGDLRDVLPLSDSSGRDWWECLDPYGGLATRTGQPERRLHLVRGPAAGRELLVAARFVRDGPGRTGPVSAVAVSLRDTAVRDREDRRRADLISTLAHELRSPVTTVKGFSSTLLTHWDRFDDAQRRELLATVHADAERLTRLIAGLLDVSRLEAHRLELHRRVVDPVALVRAVVEGRMAAGDEPERFELLPSGPLPELWADPDRVTQVVANLVDNAVRHGSGRVTVSVAAYGAEGPANGSAGPGGTGVVLGVADQGQGVAPELRAMVFRRFSSAGPRRGTGLGLYVVRGLVEAHGGTVEVDDAPGGGAVFRVLLPAGAPPYRTD